MQYDFIKYSDALKLRHVRRVGEDMKKNVQLESLGLHYEFDGDLGILKRPGYSGIPYSDGDDAENRLDEIVSRAADLSVLSDELKEHCTDWASTYHLSPTRANILRPFSESLQGSEVLEIGAGCGAITRFLGESGAKVVALEGSIRRARIARSRTRDIENVSVLAERFSDFQTEKRFDIVTLIGVLEYACLYSDAEDPVKEMLNTVRRLLKPGGRLIIAIENQLGLKYFAGAKEDHLGHRMLGLEGRYIAGGVRTFGRRDLERRVIESGFANTKLLLPFPDYKFPTSIISAEAFETPGFNVAALVAQGAPRDPQLPHTPLFAPELVWPQIVSNGLACDFSNSFLLIAKTTVDNEHERKSLAYHYSTGRKKAFCKETVFVIEQDSDISVVSSRLGSKSLVEEVDISFCPEERTNYISGSLLSETFVKIVTKDGWDFRELVEFFKLYGAVLRAVSTGESEDRQNCCPDRSFVLHGEFIDAVPQNLIRDQQLEYHFFDKEWIRSRPVSFEYMVFRSLITLSGHVTLIGRPIDEELVTWNTIFEKLFHELGLTSFRSCKGDLIAQEAELHQLTSGKSNEGPLYNFLLSELPIRVDVYAELEKNAESTRLGNSRAQYLESELARENSRSIFLQAEILRLNGFLLSAQRLAGRVRKFPFSLFFSTKQKYRRIIEEICSARPGEILKSSDE
ncbi:class I SAM-dependent methyltransferase [Agrobacterium pusense]|uniref:class I SAM-dependent methyltransferase n=1 Tax=Agrobacterium pusense TaxID=648995 RepID=UPI0028B1F6FF|nr:class I SAM-dependent methyltransferase [Agrobacterium pusense]